MPVLWRYMDFTKFVSLMETQSLFFATRLLKNPGARLSSRSRQRNVSLARLTCTIEQITGHPLWISSVSQDCSLGLLPKNPFIRNLLDVAISIPAKVPSENQSLRTIEILRHLREEGCQVENDGGLMEMDSIRLANSDVVVEAIAKLGVHCQVEGYHHGYRDHAKRGTRL